VGTLTEARAKALTRVIFDAAMAPEVVVEVHDRRAGNTRFANNQPTTEGDVETLSVTVTASIQGRSATVVGNRSDPASLRALTAEAEELAALSPIDPEHVAPMGAERMLEVDAHDRSTAKLGAEQRVRMVASAVAVAESEGVQAAGFVHHSESSFTVATSGGAFAYWPSTEAALSVTCRTADGSGSGRGAAVSHLAKRIDATALAELAADKADLSRSPKAHAPGKQLVILEAQAVGDLLSFLLRAMDARAADEGRSVFSHPDGGDRRGEELVHTSVNLRSNPADPLHPSRPFAADGQVHKVRDWIRDGALRQLFRSRHWAEQQGGEAVPRPGSLFLDGQDVDLLDLIQAVDKAVLVTRFWYNRVLDPRRVLATGLTRDGTFLVEQGKITTAVKNLRYNDSPLTLLRNVLAMGRPERVETRSGLVLVVPPMVVRDFNFSSLSDAV